MRFEDIEMLDIPDDESVKSLSPPLSTTASPDPPSDVFFLLLSPTSPDLQQWIKTDTPLVYQFDESISSKSIPPISQNAEAYVDFINKQFQRLEKISFDDIEVGESVGVVNDGFGIGAYRKRQEYSINIAFGDMTAEITRLNLEGDEGAKFLCLGYILQCFHANYFAPLVALKPELLCQWVNHFDPQPSDELAGEIMIETPKPYLHPLFWTNYLPILLIRGLHDVATNVLDNAGTEELNQSAPELYSVIEDLTAIISSYQALSLKGHFPQWKQSALAFRDAVGTLKIDNPILPQIYDISCILAGMHKTTARFCPQWYDLYCAMAQYKVRDDEGVYHEYFEIALQEKPVGPIDVDADEYSMAQQAFLDLLQGNFLKALNCIYDLNPGVAAYVAKYMEYRRLFDDYYSSNCTVPRRRYSEYFLTRHAYDNLNLHPLVPVGIGILMNKEMCGSDGAFEANRNTIDLFLPHYACQTNDDMEWAVTVCAKFGLTRTKRQLYYERGVASLNEGMIYELLNNFCDSFDMNLPQLYDAKADGLAQIHDICWERIFALAVLRSRPVDDELINNVVSHQVKFKIHPVIIQNLAPYAVLYEFFHSLAQAEEGDNLPVEVRLKKLIHLLRFNYLRKKFYPLLLCQFLPFLMVGSPKFELLDLIIIIELLDLYQVEVTEDERVQGEELYAQAIEGEDDGDRASYDWREVMTTRHKQIPPLVADLVRVIRNEVTKKVGEVFIH